MRPPITGRTNVVKIKRNTCHGIWARVDCSMAPTSLNLLQSDDRNSICNYWPDECGQNKKRKLATGFEHVLVNLLRYARRQMGATPRIFSGKQFTHQTNMRGVAPTNFILRICIDANVEGVCHQTNIRGHQIQSVTRSVTAVRSTAAVHVRSDLILSPLRSAPQ